MNELSLATEQSPIGIALADPAGRIVYSNAMFRQITGVSAAAGLPLTEILPEAAWRDLVATVGRDGIAHDEVAARRGAREIFEARVSVAALRDGGAPRFIVTLEDCSRRRAQERAERRQLLVEASRMAAAGQLVGGIAHDFNSLLGAVIGFASFLEQDLPAGTNERLFADRILAACEQAKLLVSQILSLTRARGAQRRRIDLGTVLRDSRDLLAGALPASTRLEFRLDEQALPVHGDAGEWGQVIVNLCLNANDALNGGPGTISVEARSLPVGGEDFRHVNGDRPAQSGADGRSIAGRLDEKRDYVRVRVADTGCGIEPEILQHLFEPFFTKTPGRGAGLGLAAVHGIVMADGGACTVESRRGEGTVFSIYLPLAVEPKAAGIAAASVPAQPRGCERILMVSDERELADMLSIGLERLGYEVAVVGDPAEALDVFAEEPGVWDVVIIGSPAPGMTGLALVGELMALRPASRVIFCGGFRDGITKRAVLDLGADCLAEPIDVGRLAARIRLLVDRDAPAGRRG